MEDGVATLKVGLNLLPIGKRAGGIGRHAAELPASLLEVDPSLSVTVLASRELPPMPWEGDIEVRRFPVGTTSRAALGFQLGGLPVVGAMKGLDLVHSIANLGPPRVPGLRSVTTVHDLIWAHPIGSDAAPEAVRVLRRLSFRSARWATRVQTDSRATADDLIALAGVPDERIDVVPLGVRAPARDAAPMSEVRARLALGDGPIVLTVAQKRPYKNLAAVIRALVAVPEATLVLPGSPTSHERDLRAVAERHDVASRVVFPDWVSEPELEALYEMASCVVVPSLIEGFGMPVLEGMIRGVPVACARASSLVEVAGDAAVMFDPHSDAEIGAALVALLRDGDLRSRYARAGREHATAFTWKRCAQETLDSYRRALEAPPRWSGRTLARP